MVGPPRTAGTAAENMVRMTGTANVLTGYLSSPTSAMNCEMPRKASLAGIATATRPVSFQGSNEATWSGSVDMGWDAHGVLLACGNTAPGGSEVPVGVDGSRTRLGVKASNACGADLRSKGSVIKPECTNSLTRQESLGHRRWRRANGNRGPWRVVHHGINGFLGDAPPSLRSSPGRPVPHNSGTGRGALPRNTNAEEPMA